MISDIAQTDALKKIAGAVVWYDDSEATLEDPVGFVLNALQYATLREIHVVIEAIGMDGIKEALSQARPGILTKKTWTFWHAYTGTYPPPAMPTRGFGGPEFYWPA